MKYSDGLMDIIMFPFKLIFEMIKGIFGGETDFCWVYFRGLGTRVMAIFEGLIDIITAPFNMIYGLIQDIKLEKLVLNYQTLTLENLVRVCSMI